MKKSLVFLVVFFATILSVYSQCNIPSNLGNTPVWTEYPNLIEVKYSSNPDCYIYAKVCYRTVNGEKQVIVSEWKLGEMTTAEYIDWVVNCSQGYVAKKEMISARAIDIAINFDNIFQDDEEIPFCGETLDYYAVFESNCETEFFPDFDNDPDPFDDVVPYNSVSCNGIGYCKYKYSYCSEDVDGNGILDLVVDRKTMTDSRYECPDKYQENDLIDCLPKDCYVDRRFRSPSVTDVQTYNNDAAFFSANEL